MKSFKQYLNEKLMTFGNQAYPKFGNVVILAGGAGCYPAGTEFLSAHGWKKIEDYSDGDLIVEVDKDTLIGTLAKPLSYVNLPVDQFYKFSNNRVDFITSANHTHLLIDEKTKRLYTEKTCVLHENHNKKSKGNRAKFVNSFNLQTNSRISYSDDYIRLKVAIFEDGSILPQETPKVKIRIKKQRKIDRLLYLLGVNNIDFTMNTDGEYKVFNFYIDNKDKEFEDFWYGASKEQLEVIADEIFNWDGNIKNNNIKSYFTLSKKSADFVQFVLSACGITTHLSLDCREKYKNEEKLCYVVKTSKSNCGLSKDPRHSNTSKFTEIDVGNRMYCFETNTGFFVVRQNGRVFVSGNSGKGFQLNNLVGIEGKTLDVDALKSLVMHSSKLSAKIKSETGQDISNFDLRNPDNVFKLHEIINDIYHISDKTQQYLFSSILASAPDRKPNLIFDVTLKNMSKLESITRNIAQLGYQKENIHLVWVVNDIEVAKSQNAKRDRVVPEEILMDTHEGVALTMKKVLDMGSGLKKYMDGDIYISFNKAKLDVGLEKSNAGGQYIKTANYFKVKQKGKPQISSDKLSNEIFNKISDYTPKINTWEK